MPKLFGVEVDSGKYGIFEGVEDTKILMAFNAHRKKHDQEMRNRLQIQRFLLDKKKEDSQLTEDEQKLDEGNIVVLSDAEKKAIEAEISYLRSQVEKGKLEDVIAEEAKKDTDKPADQNNEENLNEKAENDKNEAEKIEEGLNDEKVENGPEEEKDTTAEEQKTEEKKEKTTEETEKKEESKEEVKTEKKELASNEETDVKEDTEVSREKLEQETEAFAKNVEKIQNAQEKMAGPAAGNDREMMQQGPEAYLKILNDLLIEKAQKANRGLLPGDEILQYMQDLQRGKALNAQNNGVLEQQMLEKRADTIQNIGEEYQQNKKLTPKLVEQMSAVDAIDNVLISITRNPKLLFITVLLMGLNPFMALGLAVLSAFGNAVVQDLYQKLPETDRSNLENRPAQEQQPAYNPQFEACQKELAEARKQLKDQEMMLQKYQQKDMEAKKARLLQGYMAYLNSLKKAELESIKAKEEKMKQEEKAEKEVKKPEAEKEVKAEKKQSVKEEVHKDKKANLEPPVLKKPEVKKLEKEPKSKVPSMG